MNSFFIKLLYYKDLRLLFSIFFDISTVFLTPPKHRLKLAEKRKVARPICSREKLMRYLNFCFFVMKKIGMKPSCFTGSVIICRAFRSRGVDAKIVFGCMWEEKNLKGHCWIELEEPTSSETFQFVFRYPFSSQSLERS